MKTLKHLIVSVVASAGLAVSPSINAQTVTLHATDLGGGAYWFAADDISFTDQSSAFGGAGEIVCISPTLPPPFGVGELKTYEIVSVEDIFASAGTEAARNRSVDFVHWMFDEYYAGFAEDPWSLASAFQFALWGLADDFDGSVESLNLGADLFHAGTGEPLIANFDSIEESYRSSTYELNFLRDLDSTEEIVAFQHMVLVTPIPEPTSGLLIALGACFPLI